LRGKKNKKDEKENSHLNTASACLTNVTAKGCFHCQVGFVIASEL
jgi:hypothetical protein